MAILGIDEVGRGPLAGPLVIGACILPKNSDDSYPDWVDPLTDSKKLTKKKREEYSPIILEKALATGLGWVSNEEIDEIGISEALRLATRRAVEEVQKKNVPFSQIIIDGQENFLEGTKLEKYVTTVIKGDLKIKEISAASIIAKVARDNCMIKLAEKYPEYGFEKHVGYGTAAHRAAIAEYGLCPIHRQSFCSNKNQFIQKHLDDYKRLRSTMSDPTTRKIGNRAETIVAKELFRRGHVILSRNHKTRRYEIDIISTKDKKIYFTEVKYRKDNSHGAPLDAITRTKYKQMVFATTAFLETNLQYKRKYSPSLAVGLVSGPNFNFDDWFIVNDAPN